MVEILPNESEAQQMAYYHGLAVLTTVLAGFFFMPAVGFAVAMAWALLHVYTNFVYPALHPPRLADNLPADVRAQMEIGAVMKESMQRVPEKQMEAMAHDQQKLREEMARVRRELQESKE